jgi:hypothetical protein
MTIQDFEALCPKANRRTLQRDLKGLAEKHLVAVNGATNRLEYRLLCKLATNSRHNLRQTYDGTCVMGRCDKL